ncbi:hypothetical protein A3746_34130, partial [Oleibacter sp. HI0075]
MSDQLTQRATRFVSVLPHCRVLNMTVEYADGEKVILKLPYSEAIIGNPDNGIVAGGSLTTLMDTACGTAAFNCFEDGEVCPTLDLRMDYHRAAKPGENLIGEARVVKRANSLVFTQGEVRQESDNVVVATCTAN